MEMSVLTNSPTAVGPVSPKADEEWGNKTADVLAKVKVLRTIAKAMFTAS